jgi:hypothetical protein
MRTKDEVESMREKYMNVANMVGKLQQYSKQFSHVQGSLMQSCDISENQLFQLQEQYKNHKQKHIQFLQEARNQVCIFLKS